MLRYVNGDKQYQFHDLTVDVEPGHVYSKTSQLGFRTWTNKGKIIRLDSFITQYSSHNQGAISAPVTMQCNTRHY